jgi:hypothetical protein
MKNIGRTNPGKVLFLCSRLHYSFPDPAKSSGSDEDVIQFFRQVRDDILEQLPPFKR